MNNNQRKSSDIVQKINEEIIKATNESGIKFNENEPLISPQVYDLESNLSDNPKHEPISTHYNFFYKDKNDGQYKMYKTNNDIEKQQNSSIFKSFNDFKTAIPTNSPNIQNDSVKTYVEYSTKKWVSTNQLLSVSLPSNIDNSLISEGFSVFWTLSTQIDSNKSKIEPTKGKRAPKLDYKAENQNNDDDVVILSDPPMNLKNFNSSNSSSTNDKNTPKSKKRKKGQTKQQESLSLLQKQASAHLNPKIQTLPDSSSEITQSTNIPNQNALQIQQSMQFHNSSVISQSNLQSNISQNSFSKPTKNKQSNQQHNFIYQQQIQQNQQKFQLGQFSINQQQQNKQQNNLQEHQIQQNLRSASQQQTQIKQNPLQKQSLQSHSKDLSKRQQKRTIQPSNSQPQIETSQKGCIIEIIPNGKIEKKMEEEVEKTIQKDVTKDSIIAARKELIKRGMPIIPTCGVYERPQKAKRHVRERISDDFLAILGNEPSSPDNFQNTSESLAPIIPINTVNSSETQ